MQYGFLRGKAYYTNFSDQRTLEFLPGLYFMERRKTAAMIWGWGRGWESPCSRTDVK
jgi:hypothetical protein